MSQYPRSSDEHAEMPCLQHKCTILHLKSISPITKRFLLGRTIVKQSNICLINKK